MRKGYYEASARDRIRGVIDPGSWREFIPPTERITSPHLPLLDQPVAFDDGIVVGAGRLNGKDVLIAAQEGRFLGGAVGEVHGAKLVGLIERALKIRPSAVILLLDSGGVRLHEANAGLIAVSEIMRAILHARVQGVKFVGVIGGSCGCFGGMGLVARCCDVLLMSEEGRLGMSGPEVIETVRGVEEFDSRDRALVWRVTGGKHRYLIGEVDMLVDDDVAQFRAAIARALEAPADFSLEGLEREHDMLARRWSRFADANEARDIWAGLGMPDVTRMALMSTEEFTRAAENVRERP